MLNGFGVALEVIGVAIALTGAWQTWRDLADPGEQPWSPLVRAGRRTARKISDATRRLLRRPRNIRVEVGGTITAVGSLRARARVGYGPLPGTTGAAIGMLGKRSRELREALSDEQDAREDAVERLEKSIAETGERAERSLDDYRRSAATSTLDGLRLQFIGFPIVLFGLLLQGIGI
jgi:hypothetical protein